MKIIEILVKFKLGEITQTEAFDLLNVILHGLCKSVYDEAYDHGFNHGLGNLEPYQPTYLKVFP